MYAWSDAAVHQTTQCGIVTAVWPPGCSLCANALPLSAGRQTSPSACMMSSSVHFTVLSACHRVTRTTKTRTTGARDEGQPLLQEKEPYIYTFSNWTLVRRSSRHGRPCAAGVMTFFH